MASFDATVQIRRTQSDLFWFLVEPHNNLHWQTGLISTGSYSDDPVGVGSRFWEVRSVLGRRLETSFEVVGFEEPVMATIRCTSGPLPFVATYRLRGSPAGHCRLTVSGTVPDRVLPRMAGRLVAQAARRDIHRDLAQLKGFLESPVEEVTVGHCATRTAVAAPSR